jgi:hypothetical protein
MYSALLFFFVDFVQGLCIFSLLIPKCEKVEAVSHKVNVFWEPTESLNPDAQSSYTKNKLQVKPSRTTSMYVHI